MWPRFRTGGSTAERGTPLTRAGRLHTSHVGSTCHFNHSYGSPGNLIHLGENLGEQIAEPKELCEPAKFGPL